MHPILFQLGHLIVPSYGAVAAFGVFLALALAQITARHANFNPRHAWNILVLTIFSGLVASRLLLIVMNLSSLRSHPAWLLAIAMVHHPLLSGVGILGGAAAAFIYVRRFKLSFGIAMDALAAPLSLGIAAEQVGALLAGSDYGRESFSRSFIAAVVYNNPLALRWSGTPLGVALYPVQAYAAAGAIVLTLSTCYTLSLKQRRSGDVAGLWLLGLGTLLFLTEIFRDWEGRGVFFSSSADRAGIVDAPQLVGLGLVLTGGLMLASFRPPIRLKATDSEEAMLHKEHDA